LEPAFPHFVGITFSEVSSLVIFFLGSGYITFLYLFSILQSCRHRHKFHGIILELS